MMYRALLLSIASAASVLVVPAYADPVTVDVSFDRWMYPFNITPGSRASGSVFGALDSPDFDDRDAQMIFGFDLSEILIPKGQQVSRLVFRLRTAADDTFYYDPTADPLDSYFVDGIDSDTGRPLELFGVATRGAFVGLTTNPFSPDLTLFTEGDSFAEVPDSTYASRSVYAADFHGTEAVDVSNNVRERFEVDAWAVGHTDLTPGQSVPKNVDLEFVLDLSDSDIRSYVNRGLQSRELYFSVTGLHSASRDGPATFPSFYLDANGLSLGQTAQLDVEFSDASRFPCDFDTDGRCTVADINRMFEQGDLTDGVPAAEPRLDLTGDGLLNLQDRDAWLVEYGAANGSEPHSVGDANLDGMTDAADLDIWTSHRFTLANHWNQGDFNGDGLVDGSDFNLWNISVQSASAVASVVPEPESCYWWVPLATCLIACRRMSR